MKRYLLSAAVFFCLFMYAGQVGHFDEVSKNWQVKTNYFSCTFLQGNMFPGEFIPADGSRSGIILFRDTATGKDGKTYALFEERWAETKILENNENAFVIERSGRFYRNTSPVITPLKGVRVCCRYEFKKNSPEMTIRIFYRKEKNVFCKIDSSIYLNWYFKQPFEKIICGGKAEKFAVAPGKKHRFWDVSGKIALSGQQAFVELKSSRVIAALVPGALYPCRLNGGFWQYQWKDKDNLEAKAVLRFGLVHPIGK